MKRTLFLHVGYGKTGSSAIQSWLANNSANLANQGFSYTIKDTESIQYRISSGNGGPLNGFLVGLRNEEQFKQHYFNHDLANTIISSETLSLSPDSIFKLENFCKTNGIELKVIAYVRDLADWTYSAYVQGVKRHCSLMSYSDYIIGLEAFPHVFMAKMMDEQFSNITFVHYNSHKSDVVKPFSQWANIQAELLIPLANRKVNRTLTVDEIKVVQRFVSWRKRYFNDLDSFNISMLISDWLVNDYPEKESEVGISEQNITLLKNQFGHVIRDFNQSIGHKHGFTLNCFNNDTLSEESIAQSSKEQTCAEGLLESVLSYVLSREDVGDRLFRVTLLVEAYKINPTMVEKLLEDKRWSSYSAVRSTLHTLATLSPEQLIGLQELFYPAAKESARYELEPQDYLLFRDAALALENAKLDLAYPLMKIALKGRPNGKLIKDRLRRYENKLSS